MARIQRCDPGREPVRWAGGVSRSVAITVALMLAVLASPGAAWAQPVAPAAPLESGADADTESDARSDTESDTDTDTGSVSDSDIESESGSLAWFQGVPVERQERARDLYRQAVGLHKVLRFVDAIALYEEALGQWEHPQIRFELARAVFKTGRPLVTWNHLQQVWRWGDDALVGDQRERARTLEQTLLREHLAIIEARCDQPGVEVELGGKLLVRGPGGGEQVVRPGEHVLSARKEGHFSLVRSIVTVAGKRVAVAVELSPDRVVETRRWTRWKPWAVAGAGAVIGVVGVGLRLDGGRRVDNAVAAIGERCESQAICDPSSQKRFDRGTLESDVGVGTLIAGSAVVAAGLALVVVNRPRPFRSEDRGRAPIDMMPILAPSVSGDGAGVSLHIRF